MQKGFTLVELVATIIILGIVSVTVIPRFFDRSGFAEVALRDEIISVFRFAQQRAMYDHSGACYGVTIAAATMGTPGHVRAEKDNAAINDQSTVTLANDYEGLSVNAAIYYFDGVGNLLTGGANCVGTSALNNPLTIAIGDGSLASLTIHPTGYITR